MRQKDGSLVYCEHNRIGIHCLGLYGDFDVYTCALDLRHGNLITGGQPLSAGWYEECEYICSNAPKGTKYISWTKMQKNKERLKDEEKERQEKLKKAKILRENAKYNLITAEKLEKEISKEEKR